VPPLTPPPRTLPPPLLTPQPPRSPLTRTWRPPFRLDLLAVLAVHRRGRGDPAFQVGADGAVWRTCLTPDGPGTLRVAVAGALASAASSGGVAAASGTVAASGGVAAASGTVAASGGVAAAGTVASAAAWGPGAAWLLRQLPDLLGARDDPAGFAPAHGVLRDLAATHPGLRVGRTLRVLEALVPAVLEQKVVGAEASRAWRLLLRRYGEPAPGSGPGGPAPTGLRVFPPPRVWASIPSWEWHRAGVASGRARTIMAAARLAGRVEEIANMEPAVADRRLRAIAGIGPWTSAEVRQRASGDADAVSVGDYHLPAMVGWTLVGREVDDGGMLELLAPYRGHRYRATRLVELGGAAPPRRGPRLAARDYRAC
jgi:3-methyladenine DNA glycosylase/8-oxoguanine DNA glycosylase